MAWSKKLIALVAAAVLLPALCASPAGARELVEFEKEAALAANGPIPEEPKEPLEEVKEVCGSETAVFGSELFNTQPSQIKVKNEWADIVAGKDMMISGTISHVEFSGGDLSIDHPFSVDFTFDVALDEPYWTLSRELGPGAPEGGGEHQLHMELEVGQLLHALPQLAGPAEGEPWELLPFEQTKPPTQTLNHQAFENLEAAYNPHEGERIAMRGRWIIDCGHNDFHTELHPITFMAFGHQVESKTVVHVLANPYRVTELYGFGTGGVNSSPKGSTFPQALESITAVVQKGIGGVSAPISLLGGIERTQPSTAPFTVCPPAGAPAKPRIRDHFVTRQGVSVMVKALKGTNCATVTARVGNAKGGFGEYTALQPPSRQCGLPYPLVSAEVAGGLGISGVKRNEVERITVNAGGGTFTISHGGETTGEIPFNATAGEVQGALESLTSIGGPGNVAVEGGPGGEGGGTPYTVVFKGALAEKAITPLTTSHSSLTPSKTGAFLATVVAVAIISIEPGTSAHSTPAEPITPTNHWGNASLATVSSA